MPIKVNEFNIQAKVIENEGGKSSNSASAEREVPKSVKQEIIDECMDKMKELLERDRQRF